VSVRFFVLFPDNQVEVAMASNLINVLRLSLDDVWIGQLIQQPFQWISEAFQSFDDTIFFDKSPGEKKNEILDQAPDYLIDLSGNGKFWLFKNRLRVTDFTLSGKSIRAIRSEKDNNKKNELYMEEGLTLLSVFDPVESEPLKWKIDSLSVRKQYLPDSIQENYLSVNLDDFSIEKIPFFDELVSFLTVIDFPTVLVGEETRSELGDSIVKAVGCTVFNTAGVLNQNERNLIYASGKAFLGSGDEVQNIAFITRKRFVELGNDQAKEFRKYLRESNDD
jgi:hypothetical protein